MTLTSRFWNGGAMLLILCLAGGCGTGREAGGPPARLQGPATSGELPARILADRELEEVLAKARELLASGMNAGDGYGEVWIRDLNTFIELQLQVIEPRVLREALIRFLRFQGPGGDIVDGYIPEAKASIGYRYRRSASAPGFLAHKNTVETDQEASLVQAVAKYVRITGDRGILEESVEGRTVRTRLWEALGFVLRERFDPGLGLIWGATTVDWGDVQPEHAWGVELDEHSHRCVDIYDNAMFLIAHRDLLVLDPGGRPLLGGTGESVAASPRGIRGQVRRRLWDAGAGKFRPHLYLQGSPFPPGFKEDGIWYHGGTAVAIEAGLLRDGEVRATLHAMRENVRRAGAASIGLTVYPPYPDGLFLNPGMKAWSYQNGGDWCWFGGRMVRQLIAHGLVTEAYEELKPMVSRVLRHGGFHEWWTRDNQPRGSGKFRGSAGVLGMAIVELRDWARAHEGFQNPPP